MSESLAQQGIASRMNLRQMLAPLLIVLILSMMVLPLPAFALDVFFTFNIAISIMVLLVAMYTMKPLDFAIFPTVLLVTTLLRLSLNVASTRVVLLHGHTGPDAAGKVIEAFGHFLVGGNYAVGIVVFIILTLINFIVITKGAGRIAEVSARFTLDAMPGKQMAIDADLNAGLIGEDEARKRRANVALEADFFGSMDGASKFVRGDAVAGILILFINIIGGLIVGVLQHDMSAGDAAKTYTLLTIGDGLVAQIPALIISTAAGLVVTRVATEQDIGQQLVTQLFGNPMVLALTAGILGILGLIPGMPNLVFLLLASILGYLAWRQFKSPLAAAKERSAEAAQPAAPVAESVEASWSDVVPVDMLGLEVGYRLIPLVDRGQAGELLKRIRGLRKKFAQEIGFLPAQVHIRDNLELRPNVYRLSLKGVPIGEGEAFPGQYLAINPGRVSGQLAGTPTQDPAFGLPATLDRRQFARAGARVRLYRGGCQHGDRDTPEPCDPFACHRIARTPGNAGPARSSRHRIAQAGGRPGTQADRARRVAAGVAEPARRGRQYSRHAHHHRNARRTRAARAGSDRADLPGADRARPRHRPAALSDRQRDAGDGPRTRPRAAAGAGLAGGRRRRRHRAWPGRYAAAGNGRCRAASGRPRIACSAAGAAPFALASFALPAACRAAAQGHLEWRGSRFENYQGDIHHRS
jgi:hypothetical protein